MAIVGVTFLRAYQPWNAGERAGIDEKEAARLVKCGDAVYRDKNQTPAPRPVAEAKDVIERAELAEAESATECKREDPPEEVVGSKPPPFKRRARR